MGNETKMGEQPDKYDEVVRRLEDVVKRLEGGELSLEDSLQVFEEGVGLVKRGEKLLSTAEKRIEQLLEQDGEGRVVPLNLQATGQTAASPKAPSSGSPPPAADASEDEDIPF
jgi:exodeoxyribonuclease VII small subunit